MNFKLLFEHLWHASYFLSISDSDINGYFSHQLEKTTSNEITFIFSENQFENISENSNDFSLVTTDKPNRIKNSLLARTLGNAALVILIIVFFSPSTALAVGVKTSGNNNNNSEGKKTWLQWKNEVYSSLGERAERVYTIIKDNKKILALTTGGIAMGATVYYLSIDRGIVFDDSYITNIFKRIPMPKKGGPTIFDIMTAIPDSLDSKNHSDAFNSIMDRLLLKPNHPDYFNYKAFDE